MKVALILLLSVVSAFAQIGTTISSKTTSAGSGSTEAGCVFVMFRVQAAATWIAIGNMNPVTSTSFTLPIYGDYFGGSGSRLPSISYRLLGGGQTLFITEAK